MRDKLFNSAGYILAKDYVEDIQYMQKHGPWKLPLGVGDRLHFFFLVWFLRFSWFKDVYIKYPHDHSPAYNIILNFLRKGKTPLIITKLSGVFFRDIKAYSLRLVDNGLILIRSTGHSENSSTAFSKTIGEFVERSVTGLYDENMDIVFGSFSELKIKYKNIFYPPKYHRFLPQQKQLFKELNIDDDQKIAWVKGFNFLTNEIALIPRHITSWRSKRETVLMDPTTSGSAGGFSEDYVVKNSILEYIERDSFFVYWLTRIPPKVIANESLPNDLLVYVESFNDMGIDIYILDITTDIRIPSICVVTRINNLNRKAVAISGGAGVNLHTAIKKALEEAQQCLGNLFIGENKIKVADITPFTSDINREERITMWQGDEWVGLFEWFISGDVVDYKNKPKATLDIKGEVAFLKDAFSKLGSEYTPFIYFPKNKAMNKLGFYVAQSSIPFCFPLYLVEKYGTFDSDRLKQFAKYKGVDNFKLNPYPHPFP